MDYTTLDRLPQYRGKNWFGHRVTTYFYNTEKMKLNEFLAEEFGPKSDLRWRVVKLGAGSQLYTVKFQTRIDAMHFMFTWNESVPRSISDFDIASMYPYQIAMRNFLSNSPTTPNRPFTFIQHKGRGNRHLNGAGKSYASIFKWFGEKPKPYWDREAIDGDIMSTNELMERLKNEDH